MYGIANQPILYASISHFTFKWQISSMVGLNLKALFQMKSFYDSLLKSQKTPKQLTSLSHFMLFIPGKFPHAYSYSNSSVMPFHHIPAVGSELKITKKSITRDVKSKAVC